MLQYRLITTAWGVFGIVARDGRLLATYLPAAKRAVMVRVANDHPGARVCVDLLPDLSDRMIDYFDGHVVDTDVELDLSGVPPFRRRVLEAARRIPYGETTTYGALARRVGSPQAARAVGSAMASNPLPIVVPCHRVLRSDGGLGGFSSDRGVADKKRLLSMEASAV